MKNILHKASLSAANILSVMLKMRFSYTLKITSVKIFVSLHSPHGIVLYCLFVLRLKQNTTKKRKAQMQNKSDRKLQRDLSVKQPPHLRKK